MTVKLELVDGDEAALKSAAKRANVGPEQFATLAVMEAVMRSQVRVAGPVNAEDFANRLARWKADATGAVLPEAATRRENIYEGR